MDVKELKELDVAGLKKELNEQGEALFKLRLQKATQQLHNTNQLGRRLLPRFLQSFAAF